MYYFKLFPLILTIVYLSYIASDPVPETVKNISGYVCSELSMYYRSPYASHENCKRFCSTINSWETSLVPVLVYQPRRFKPGHQVCGCKITQHQATCRKGFFGGIVDWSDQITQDVNHNRCQAYCEGRDINNLGVTHQSTNKIIYGALPKRECLWWATTTVTKEQITVTFLNPTLDLSIPPFYTMPGDLKCVYDKHTCEDMLSGTVYLWGATEQHKNLCPLDLVASSTCKLYHHTMPSGPEVMLECPTLPGLFHLTSAYEKPSSCDPEGSMYVTTENLVVEVEIPDRVRQSFSVNRTLLPAMAAEGLSPMLEDLFFVLQGDMNKQTTQLCNKLCSLENRVLQIEKNVPHDIIQVYDGKAYKIAMNKGDMNIKACTEVDQMQLLLPLSYTCDENHILVNVSTMGTVGLNLITNELTPRCNQPINRTLTTVFLQINEKWVSVDYLGHVYSTQSVDPYFTNTALRHKFALKGLNLVNERDVILSSFRERLNRIDNQTSSGRIETGQIISSRHKISEIKDAIIKWYDNYKRTLFIGIGIIIVLILIYLTWRIIRCIYSILYPPVVVNLRTPEIQELLKVYRTTNK